MIEFFVSDGPPRRVVCRSALTYRLFWPYFLTRAVPEARSLCSWAARGGAAVSGAVRLQMDSKKGCQLIVTRAIHAGRPLLSVPLTLAPSVVCGEDLRGTFSGHWSSLEELAGLLVRHLHDRQSPYRWYLEFLHDLYNSDVEDEDVVEGSGSHHSALMHKLDALYGGNSLYARGVANAPFISKKSIQTAAQRVEWGRVRALLRRLEQSVPYFAAKSVAWGLSMVLSRSIVDGHEGRTMYPLIDFCSHSFEPNSRLEVAVTPEENLARGVQWHRHDVPCAHLIAERDIHRGEEITVLYSHRGTSTLEDIDYWKMHWGFVPEKH